MMRIIYLSYYYWPPQFGGGLLHTIERLEEMSHRGHNIVVLTSGEIGFETSEIKNGLNIERSKFKKHYNFITKLLHHLVFLFWSCFQLLKLKYDVIQVGSLPGNSPMLSYLLGILVLKICRLKKAKTVYLFSLADSTEQVIILDGIRGKIRKAFFKCIDSIVVNSPLLYDSMRKIFGSNVEMILNGAKNEVFKPDSVSRSSIRNKHGVDDKTIIFSFVGTISRRKGLDTLLAAYATVRDQLSKSMLWIIGPATRDENQNIEESEYDQLITSARKIPNVVLWGRIDDREELARLLSASDVFVFPTRREGMPMAPLQAMSSGLPVIISRIHGITDLASIEGETGYYIETGDSEKLAELMVKLGGDMRLRQEMGMKARAIIEKSFSWKNHIDDWEKLYCKY